MCLVHAAVMAINEVLEKEDVAATLRALQNPAACLVDVQSENGPRYQVALLGAKREKSAKAGAQVYLPYCKRVHVQIYMGQIQSSVIVHVEW